MCNWTDLPSAGKTRPRRSDGVFHAFLDLWGVKLASRCPPRTLRDVGKRSDSGLWTSLWRPLWEIALKCLCRLTV